MRKILIRIPLIFIAAIFFPGICRAQWTPLPGPFGGEVYFVQQYAGAYWAGAESGLYRSPDGIHWEQRSELGNVRMVAGLADNDTLYLVRGGSTSQVLTTIDGGQTWTTVEVANANPERYVTLKKSAGVLLVAGITSNTLYLRSKNNGATFQSLPGGGPNAADLFDAGNTLITWYNGSGLRISTNGGNTFFSRPLPPGNNVSSKVVVTDSAIVTLGQSLQVSFDTAQSWQTINLPAGFSPDNVNLRRSGKKGIFILTYGNCAWTEDYGLNWKVFTAPQVPRQLLKNGNNWLISSLNGFYRSPDEGANWTDVSQGFSGHFIYRVYSTGNRLYAMTTNDQATVIHRYYTEPGSGTWSELSFPMASSDFFAMGFHGLDTLMTYDQISLDGGATWTYVNYPNVFSFSIDDIEIHNNKAYIPNENKIQVVPLQASATAQFIYGPNNDYCGDVLFSGDTLYTVTSAGRVFRQLPNTTTWTALTPAPPWYFSKLFRVNGRFFHPRQSSMLYSDDGLNFQTLPVSGIPWSPTHFIAINDMLGVDSVIVAASLDIGFIFSVDKGEHWWPFQTGLPDDATTPLNMAQINGSIYAAMFRQGIWQRNVQIGSSNGIVYRDDNQNGTQEANEPPLPNQKVLAAGSDNLVLSDTIGRYQLVFDHPADTVRAVLPVTYGSVQPAYRWVSGSQQNQDFGIWLQPDVTDLTIYATNSAAVRPGFDNSLLLSIINSGTVYSDASVGLKLPPGVVYLSANPSPAMIAGDSLIWNLDSISYLGRRDIDVQIQINSNVPLGQILTFHVVVSPVNTDAAPVDNDFVLQTTVVGSYDPNDKQVWPGAAITPAQIAAGEALRYTIRFQNTGNYPATRVRLIDTLDANADLSTLKIIGASHPYSWRVLGGHVLEILFENIQLPDSMSNPAGSHGFFSFSIQGKKDLTLGAELHNRAYIYFDFNTPVITNTVETKVSIMSRVSGISDPSLRLMILPNPASSRCTIQTPSAGGTLSVFDVQGKLLHWIPSCPAQIELSVQAFPEGVYGLRWQKGSTIASGRMVIGR